MEPDGTWLANPGAHGSLTTAPVLLPTGIVAATLLLSSRRAPGYERGSDGGSMTVERVTAEEVTVGGVTVGER